MVEGMNPPTGRPDGHRRMVRLAHRAPLRGPAGSRRDLGAALIEAAYVLPVFFLLIFGIMEIGLYMNDDLAVGHTVRSGSRMASASGNDMPARTADARLSTASGHTSANSRCRRRARPLTTATGR